MSFIPLKQRRLKRNRALAMSERIRKMVVFAMLGTLMFVSKIVMEFLPNIHLLGALTMIYTIVYRKQALIPIYVYVFLNGLYSGFNLWWVPYCYVWTVLWAITMLLPKKMSVKIAIPVYMIVCGFHGLIFGALYAPFQALAFGLDLNGMLLWIISGFPFDVMHAFGNLVAGILIVPLAKILDKLERKYSHNPPLFKNDKENLQKV